MLVPYRPEPYVNFTEPGPRQQMLAALQQVRQQLGRTYPLRIGGKKIETEKKIASVMPARHETVVGHVSKAGREQAAQAMEAALKTFPTWSRVDPETRARILFKAAAIMRRRVYEVAAWMCFEVSKSWIEAYADACEAIDFLEFYGREMVRLGGPQPVTPYPGEDNELLYMPLGVGVVIPPWNFPLAICTGMTSAAIVTGNTVVLKPASTSPVIAAKMVEIFEEAGLPPGVLNFCPGSGGEIGDYLVEHPKTRFVSFTGSMEVGLNIFQKCGMVGKDQIWLRLRAEMGAGLHLVDETADVEAAAEASSPPPSVSRGRSARPARGPSCTRTSRRGARARGRAGQELTIGDTTSEENLYMGAVIDDASFRRSTITSRSARRKGGRCWRDSVPAGYFVPPTIIADVDPNARIAQEEIFGPVLAVIKAKDFDDGLAIVNGTRFGLTALYPNDRFRLERARHEFHVGNLYFNRKCTGALVDVQPFGGFNMSGTDSKAGGRDYLLLFMQGKSIAERL